MKVSLIILVILVIISYINPSAISNLFKSIPGKFIFLMLLIYTALNCKAACFLLAILFISLLDFNTNSEYFDPEETMNQYKLQYTAKQNFLHKQCKKTVEDGKDIWDVVHYDGDKEKILDIDSIENKKILSEDSSTSYKIKFKDEECNPCYPDCQYTVTESSEKITTEEQLRPQETSIMLG